MRCIVQPSMISTAWAKNNIPFRRHYMTSMAAADGNNLTGILKSWRKQDGWPGRMGIRYSPIAMSTRIESANHMHHGGQQCKEEGKDGRHFRCRHFKSSFVVRESNTLVPLWNGHLGWPPGTGAKAYLVHANPNTPIRRHHMSSMAAADGTNLTGILKS